MKFVKIFVDCHGFCDTDYIIPKKVICANCKHHLIGKKTWLCTSPTYPFILDKITGIKKWKHVSKSGWNYWYYGKFPLCEYVNRIGRCRYFEEKEKV